MALLRNPRLALLRENRENAPEPKRLGLKGNGLKATNSLKNTTTTTATNLLPRVALNDIRNRQGSSNALGVKLPSNNVFKSKALVSKPEARKPLRDRNTAVVGAAKPKTRRSLTQKPPVTGRVPVKKVEDEPPTKYFAPVLRSRKSHGLADTSGHHSDNLQEEVVEKRSTRSSDVKHDLLDGELISALAACGTSSAIKETAMEHNESGIGAYTVDNNVLPAGVQDIDEDDVGNPLMVTDYVQDIYLYLRRLEEHQTIRENFLIHSGVSGKMRSIVVDWMIDVQIRFKLLPESLYMAVGLMDRFLQEVMVAKSKLQLLGATALFIASKYEEIYAPEIGDFEYITDSSCDTSTIRKMELLMLRTLDFKLGRPLAIHFLRRYSKAADADATRHTIGKFICELSLIDCTLAAVNPSLIAATACHMASVLVEDGESWGPEMVHYSGYKLEQFKHLIKPIAELLIKLFYLKSFAQKAVLTKYESKKFMCIAKEAYFEETNLRKLFL